MIEIYRDTSERLSLTINSGGAERDADGPVTVTLYEDSTDIVLVTDTAEKQAGTTGRYYFDIPLNLTVAERHIRVEWTFSVNGSNAQKVDQVFVVTPYIYPYEYLESVPDSTLTYDQVAESERVARQVINAYTGQKFGQYTATYKVYPNSVGTLNIFVPIIRIDSIKRYGQNSVGFIMPDSEVVPHTSDTYEIKFDGRVRWGPNDYFMVTGLFGYKYVPTSVSTAARLLINDMSCKDHVYRQRGVQAVRAADWRLDFHDLAFSGTGNIDVDLLLSPFKVRNAVII